MNVIERGSLVGLVKRVTPRGHYEVKIMNCSVGDYHKLGDVVIWDKTSRVTQRNIQFYCRYCNHPLTDELSIFRGYGRDCAAQRGLPWGVTSELEELAT